MKVMTGMTNPRKVRTWSEKFTSRAKGMKFYRTGFELGEYAKFSARSFRTASDAEQYGVRVLLRWMRLYDAAILAQMTSASSAATEEAQVVKV